MDYKILEIVPTNIDKLNLNIAYTHKIDLKYQGDYYLIKNDEIVKCSYILNKLLKSKYSFNIMDIRKILNLLNNMENIKVDEYIGFYINKKYIKRFMNKIYHFFLHYNNLYYFGNIFCDNKITKLHATFIFKKSMEIPIELYNPPIRIQDVLYDNKKLNIIRDDLIPGGTKLRGCMYLKDICDKYSNIKEITYIGAPNGYAQLALSYSMRLFKKSNIKLSLYRIIDQTIEKDNYEMKYLEKLTLYYHPNTQYIDNIDNISYNNISVNANILNTDVFIPSGFDTAEYKTYLRDALNKSIDHTIKKSIHRLWLPCGSGVLFDVLYNLLPDTFFCLVHLKGKLDLSKYDIKRYRSFISSYGENSMIETYIPYDTIKGYDGKIWEFSEFFLNDDFIWNVGAIKYDTDLRLDWV